MATLRWGDARHLQQPLTFKTGRLISSGRTAPLGRGWQDAGGHRTTIDAFSGVPWR